MSYSTDNVREADLLPWSSASAGPFAALPGWTYDGTRWRRTLGYIELSVCDDGTWNATTLRLKHGGSAQTPADGMHAAERAAGMRGGP